MIRLPTHFKFYRNRSADFDFNAQSLERTVGGGNLIRLSGRDTMARRTECQFLLYAVSIVDLNSMANSVAGIRKETPVSCFLNEIALGKLLILFFCHITQRTICLASLLHIHGELQGRNHVKCERDN